MQITITPAMLPEELPVLRALFTAYGLGLSVDLAFQDFNAELATLPGKYAAPEGALLLARRDGKRVVGCVALRPHAPGLCEMKRLYVAPEGRGHGVGRKLCHAVIEAARHAGYQRMVLDTLEQLQPALRLYQQLGFTEVPPYYDNPLPGVHYLGLDLHIPQS